MAASVQLCCELVCVCDHHAVRYTLEAHVKLSGAVVPQSYDRKLYRALSVPMRRTLWCCPASWSRENSWSWENTWSKELSRGKTQPKIMRVRIHRVWRLFTAAREPARRAQSFKMLPVTGSEHTGERNVSSECIEKQSLGERSIAVME